MGSFSFSSSVSLTCLLSHHQQYPSQSHLTNPIFSHKFPLTNPPSPNFIKKTLFLRSSPTESSQFLDENGAVDDMDGYLNYLSLEYDSVWDTKPAWCQPWTITLTGVLAISGSWIILHNAVITALVLFVIGAWWYIFLYSYPKSYSDMIAERRKKVTTGAEDTFGARKSQ